MNIYDKQKEEYVAMIKTERCKCVKAKWKHEFLSDEWCKLEDRDSKLIKILEGLGYNQYGEKIEGD